MSAPLTAFAGAQDKNAEQQRALLAAISEQGSAGAASYKQAQEQNQQLQQGALAAATGISKAGTDSPVNAAPSAQLGGTLALNSAMLGNAQQTFDQDISRQSAANSNYMGQLGAAIPIVESRTRMGVEQMLAEQQAKREARAMEAEMARLSLQGQREQLAGQREARAAAKAERAAESKNGGLTAYQREQIRLAEADNNRASGLDQEKRDAAADEARAAKREKFLVAEREKTALARDDKGAITKDSQSYQAIHDVLAGNMTLDQAIAAYPTRGGKKLNRAHLEGVINRHNSL